METHEVSQDENKRKNRKRKKSFLQNAKKYGKKGTYGRGTELTQDTYQYFVNALEILKKGFETTEEREIFVNNVLEQTVNEEVNYSRNQVGCRIIETLLPSANDDILKRYYQAFNDDLRPLLSDRFASFVIQMLVKIAAYKSIGYTSEQKNTDNPIESSYAFANKISKFLLNNLEDFVWDTYANHIIRTVIESLAGIFENNDKKGKQDSIFKDIPKTELLNEFKEIVTEYAERLLQWPQFIDLPYEELTSGLLQTLVTTVRKIDSKLAKKLIKKLLEDSFLGEEYQNTFLERETKPIEEQSTLIAKILPPVFESEPAVRLLETVIMQAKSKMFTQIYAKCFTNNLVELAKLRKTNFTVQKLLSHCSEKTELEAIYDELSPELENIFLTGHTGIILCLAQACKRLGTRQGNFVQQLMITLHCNEPTEKQNFIVPLTLRMIPLERIEKVNFIVSLHGSIIIQTLLEFNKPIKIINSILNMELDDLKKMFCDSKGCHIMDSYMSSTFVGEKSREKLIRKLQGTYQELASNKYGSRSFDALWKMTNLKQKLHIMDELSHKEAGWSNSEFGKIIAAKLNMPLYRRSKEQWQSSLNKTDKTKELFSDIIGDVK